MKISQNKLESLEAVSVVKARNVCIGVLECIETEYKHSLPEHSPLTDNKINMTHHTNIAYQRGPCISPDQAELHWKVGLLVLLSSKGMFPSFSIKDFLIWLIDLTMSQCWTRITHILLSKQQSVALQSMHFISVILWVISIIYCRIDEFLTWKL